MEGFLTFLGTEFLEVSFIFLAILALFSWAIFEASETQATKEREKEIGKIFEERELRAERGRLNNKMHFSQKERKKHNESSSYYVAPVYLTSDSDDSCSDDSFSCGFDSGSSSDGGGGGCD